MQHDGTPRPAARIAALAWPILLGQLAVIGNGVLDTAMTSRYSAIDLAALAIAVSIYVCVFVSANGVLYALAPIIGQHYGAGRFEAIGAEVRQGLWLAAFLTAGGCLLLLFPQPLLALAQVSPELNQKASSYLQLLAAALPATLAFRIYAVFNTAIARPRAVMLIQIGALLLKLPLNAWFIYGGLGLPAMGGPGCALATAAAAWLSLAAGWAHLRLAPHYRAFGLFGHGFTRPEWRAQGALLRLGMPMGASYLIEVSAFTFMALFIARQGDTAVAGHQIAANFCTVLYMVPLSLGSAGGTLVAHALGAGNPEAARRIGNAAMLLAAGIAACAGLAVLLGSRAIVHAYTPDPLIAAAALPLFALVAMFHIFDALQINAAYILRAYKITLVPTLIYAAMLWGVGLGGGYMLGFDLLELAPVIPDGARGFWLANAAGVALAAALLLWHLLRVRHRMR